MKKSKLICTHIFLLILVLLAWFTYSFLDFIGFFNSYTVTDKGCVKRDGIKGAEDITRYNDDIAFMGSADRKLMMKNVRDIPETQGAIYAVSGLNDSNADLETLSVEKMPLVGYPQGLPFMPHGMDIHEGLLYVINHANNKGGERIEVLRIDLNDTTTKPKSLTYLWSI